MSPQQEPTAQPPRRHRVVIIGSGFGGLNAAKKLKRADVDIKLIARTTHHLFQPLLVPSGHRDYLRGRNRSADPGRAA